MSRFSFGIEATTGKEIKTLLDHPHVQKMQNGSPMPPKLRDRISQSTMCGFESSPCIYDTENTGHVLTEQGWEAVSDMKSHSICGQSDTVTAFQQQLSCPWKPQQQPQQPEQKGQSTTQSILPTAAPTQNFSNREVAKTIAIMGILFLAFLCSGTKSASSVSVPQQQHTVNKTARKPQVRTIRQRHPTAL